MEAVLEVVDDACTPLDGVPMLLVPGAVVLTSPVNESGYDAEEVVVVDPVVDTPEAVLEVVNDACALLGVPVLLLS
jgi:hypothetical protein